MDSGQEITPESVAGGKRQVSWRGYLLLLAGLAGFVLLVAVGAYLMWSRALARRVEDQLAELRRAGRPVTAEELEAYYEIPPPEKDVAPLLTAAVSTLQTPEYELAATALPIVGSGSEIPPPGQTWPQHEAARAFVQQYAGPLQQLHKAAERGGAARYSIGFENGALGMSLDHAYPLRVAARLLALEAHLRAHEGDATGTAQSIRALLSLSRSIEHEPLLISQLIHYALLGVAYSAVDELLPHIRFADHDLALLQSELRRTDIATGFRRSLVGERAMGLDIMERPEQLAEAMVEIGSPIPWTPRDADRLLYLEVMQQYIAAAEQPWPEALVAGSQISHRLDAAVGDTLLGEMRYPMSVALLPALEASITTAAQSDARRTLIESLIAVERYRREHGEPPQQLEDLIPAFLAKVPLDPFTGSPLRYQLRDEAVVIYSVGQNQLDDGGQGDLHNWDLDAVVRLPTAAGR